MIADWTIEDVGLDDLQKLAEQLAVGLKVGDTITLNGELGSGKTTFARFLINSLHQDLDKPEVSSPTFSIMQHYPTSPLDVFHFDLYRLHASGETDEIGLDDALDDGVCIIEWPDLVIDALPPERLDITFGESSHRDVRQIRIFAHGKWKKYLERLKDIDQFLLQSGWGEAHWRFMTADASTRNYIRLNNRTRKAVLMDAPSQPDGPVIQDGRTYSDLAHLAESVDSFVALSEILRSAGLSAPEVFAHQLEKGLLLIEDLGDDVFRDLVTSGTQIERLYQPALDVLQTITTIPIGNKLSLPDGQVCETKSYDETAYLIEIQLFVQWYWKLPNGNKLSQADAQDFMDIWKDYLRPVLEAPACLVLRDYHSPNLLWLPQRQGVARVGLIDFQDALIGSPAYDVVSLLQDARVDIPQNREINLLNYYVEKRSKQDSDFREQQFRRHYAILGAQRSTKILGIFARLSIRDGKNQYLQHMPRIWGYLERNLANPYLSELKHWYDNTIPDRIRRI